MSIGGLAGAGALTLASVGSTGSLVGEASKIAAKLNGEGLKTSRGKPFNESRVRRVMRINGLHSVKKKIVPLDELANNEWRIVDLMNETNLSYGHVYRMIQANRITGRKGKMGRWIVSVDKQMLEELKRNLNR